MMIQTIKMKRAPGCSPRVFGWFSTALLSLMCAPAFGMTEVGQGGSGLSPSPKLVVVIAIDQLRRDRLFESTHSGLGRLVQAGRIFTDGQVAHGITTTCPGHASILTGLNPEHHGLPSNSFLDRATGKVRYCVGSDDPAHSVLGGKKGRSPTNLRADTLGDWLKAKNPEHRVFSVSAKDRAAITLGGMHPDGVYWFDSAQGRFTTSGYYENALPSYVLAFNGQAPSIDGFMRGFPERWDHAAGAARVDDYHGEDPRYDRVSGHPLKAGTAEEIAKQVYASPFIDEATIALAQLMVTEEALGQGSALDLLSISLSATDTVGHLYGPRSAEAADALDRLDQMLGQFLSGLDEQLGANNYWVVLTADHGVAELPEWARENNALNCPSDEGRLTPIALYLGLNWHLYRAFTWPFGDPRTLLSSDGGHLYVQEAGLLKFGLTRATVVAEVITYLESKPEIEKVWGIEALSTASGELAEAMKRSLVPDRLGDALVQMAEGCLIDELGTTHGSPHNYDRDIPIVFYGAGIEPGKIPGPAYSIDIAATLAHYLGVVPDHRLDGAVLDLTGKARLQPVPVD
ncbi:MAG: alkaline phosphatase family protein [Pseudomonadales bacterium]